MGAKLKIKAFNPKTLYLIEIEENETSNPLLNYLIYKKIEKSWLNTNRLSSFIYNDNVEMAIQFRENC